MNEETIKNEILKGLQQVDSSFTITDFYLEFDEKTRNISGSFTATTESGETVSEVINYAE